MIDLDKIEILEELPNELDWGVKSINAPSVWNTTQGEGVKIAVMDTGLDMSHEIFKDRVKRKFNMINRNYDISDEYGHGTMVAGLILDVAPKSELYVTKVLDKNGLGSISNIMNGITFAINNNVDILCISLGMNRDLPLILKQRIVEAYEKGITIVSAVGNNNRSEPLYPSKMDEVIGVGGLDKDMKLAEFSNRGYDVLAPSVEILSKFKDGKYARMTGTSFASPLVAGGIALLISHHRNKNIKLNPKEIKEMISNRNFNLTELIE